MTEFQPGYPTDLRPAVMRQRAARGFAGDQEAHAGRVIARYLGDQARVFLQDDNSVARMVDIRIDYCTKDAAFVEVVGDISGDYAKLDSEIRGGQRIEAKPLRHIWWVTLEPTAKLKTLLPQLQSVLARLEADECVFDNAGFYQQLHLHPHELVRQLAATGVVWLNSSAIRDRSAGRIWLACEGAGGPAVVDWSGFAAWLTDHLNSQRLADVRLKLRLTQAAERHIFILTSFTTPWTVLYALSRDHRELPADALKLPDEITHLWIWGTPVGRCIAWFPETGWFEPSAQWATD